MLRKIDTSINQYQGTGQPVLSTIWTKIKQNCKTCGKEFETGFWSRDGEAMSKVIEICQDCREADVLEKHKAESLAKLPEVIEMKKNEWRETCGIPLRYFDKTFDNFNSKLQPAAFKVMTEYNQEKSIVLSSPDLYGVGKTHLAAALVNKIIETSEVAKVLKNGDLQTHRNPIVFTTEAAMLSRIRATYNHREGEDREHETEERIFTELQCAINLFIDDVGKVRPNDYSFLQSVYFRIIDYRYNEEHPIILTTNLSFIELEKHIGGACADRLREMCGKNNLITMIGKSQRK